MQGKVSMRSGTTNSLRIPYVAKLLLGEASSDFSIAIGDGQLPKLSNPNFAY